MFKQEKRLRLIMGILKSNNADVQSYIRDLENICKDFDNIGNYTDIYNIIKNNKSCSDPLKKFDIVFVSASYDFEASLGVVITSDLANNLAFISTPSGAMPMNRKHLLKVDKILLRDYMKKLSYNR